MVIKKGLKLILDLPPSINAAFTWNPYIHALAHTKEAKDYLEVNSWIVKEFCMKHRIKPINTYFPIHLYFFLRRKGSDSHNYKKLSFDCLQKGGLFENDLYILDKTESVMIDAKNPRIELIIPIKLSTFSKDQKEL